MSEKGIVLWVDGVEGCGKTTTVKNTTTVLRKLFPKKKVLSFNFPNNDPLPIRDFVLSRENDNGDLFAHTASILATIEKYILPEIDAGNIIVCDRSILTMCTLQLHGEVDAIQSVLKLLGTSEIWTQCMSVSHYFLLIAPAEVIHNRLTSRGILNVRDNLSITDIIVQSVNFQKAVSAIIDADVVQRRIEVISEPTSIASQDRLVEVVNNRFLENTLYNRLRYIWYKMGRSK